MPLTLSDHGICSINAVIKEMGYYMYFIYSHMYVGYAYTHI